MLNYRLMQGLCASLPARWCEALAGWAADRRYHGAPDDRAAVRANMALALEPRGPVSEEMVHEVFRNFGRYLYEFFSAHQAQHLWVALHHPERVQHAANAGRGVIILSAHVGNWELGGIVLGRLGYAMSAVALPHVQGGIDRLFNAQRRRCGVQVIPLGPRAARTAMKHLRQGGLLAVLGDREFGDNGLQARLFRQPVIVPRGPALLSVRTGAPIVPSFLLREGFRRFRFLFDEALWPSPTAPARAEVERLALASTQAIERVIRHAPAQWLMMQPVAVTRP